MDYAAYAELLGLQGIRVDDPDDVAAAWDEAFAADRPVVLDVHTDATFHRCPPTSTFDQARGVADAMLHGDPEAGESWRTARPGGRLTMFARLRPRPTRPRSAPP